MPSFQHPDDPRSEPCSRQRSGPPSPHHERIHDPRSRPGNSPGAGAAPADDLDVGDVIDGRIGLTGSGLRERLRSATWSAADTAVFLDIRPMRPTDLPRTAFWHRTALPRAFFTQLGPRFLRRWQQTYLDSPHAVALVAERTDVLPPQPVGFLLAAIDSQAHRAHILRHHRLPLTALGLGALLTRPTVLVRFLRIRAGRYIQRVTCLPTRGGLAHRASPMAVDAASGSPAASPGAPRPAERAPVAAVVALVVDVEVRRSGVGRAPLDAFSTLAEQAGAGRAELVTAWGSGAEAFYERCGWSRATKRPNRDGSFVFPFHLDLNAEVHPDDTAERAAHPTQRPTG